MKLSDINIEVVKQMKLLGVVITEDLKWHENTGHITKKSNRILWILRLKTLGESGQTLVDVCNK